MNEYLGNPEVGRILEAMKSGIKSIREEGMFTLVEFNSGEVIPLTGGMRDIIMAQPIQEVHEPELECSFCGSHGSKENLLISPPSKESPLLCSKCAVLAVQTFARHGVKMDFEIDFS